MATRIFDVASCIFCTKNQRKPLFIFFILYSSMLLAVHGVDQKFAIEPSDRTAVLGENVQLPCRILHRVGILQWTRDDFGLGDDRQLSGYPRYRMTGEEEEGEYSLHIQNVNLQDDAVFQCQVGAAIGIKGIRSRSATLTVLVPPKPPKIVQGPKLKARADVEIELICEAHGGKPAAELTWLDGDGNKITTGIEKSNELLSDGKRWNSVLKLTMVPSAEHDGKRFTCSSENSAMVQPQTAYIDLEVEYSPEVKQTINREIIKEFDEVIIKCDTKANPSEVLYKWFKNDEVVVGDFADTYTIPRITRDFNDATVSCEVNNPIGTTKVSYVLSVLYPPTVKKSVEKYAAEEGKDVTLTCDIEGNPIPEIIWSHEDSDKVLGVGSELTIKNLTIEHTGRYTCRAVAQGFKEVTLHSLLFVKGPPKVHSDKVQYGVEGKTARVECLAYSVPPPIKMNWTINNLPLDLSRKRFEIVEESLADGIRQVLIIENVKEDDFTSYNCSVTNEYGMDTIQIQLYEQKTLPLLIILTVVIVGIVVVVTITIVVILCVRKKSLDKDEFTLPAKITKPMDTISSNGSDLKIEVHTNSSLSHNDTTTDHWENTSDETQTGKTNDIYRYSNDYSDPMFALKSETQNNNGYVPYVDYSRDYTPPLTQQRHNVSNDSGLYDSHQQLDNNYKMQGSTYQPVKHSSVPHLQNTNYGSSTMSHNMPMNSHMPQNIYITSPTNPTPLKPGTLATHV